MTMMLISIVVLLRLLFVNRSKYEHLNNNTDRSLNELTIGAEAKAGEVRVASCNNDDSDDDSVDSINE